MRTVIIHNIICNTEFLNINLLTVLDFCLLGNVFPYGVYRTFSFCISLYILIVKVNKFASVVDNEGIFNRGIGCKLFFCLVIQNKRFTVSVNCLTRILRLILPIAKPTLKLLALCYIVDFPIDIIVDSAYNDIRTQVVKCPG